jgi:selT/selW/selH-like putative selenoprotein
VRHAIANDARLSSLAVSGGTHPIGVARERVVQGAQVLQYSLLALFALGDRYVFPALRVREPEWFAQVRQNRVGYLMLTFFAGNMVSANLQKTGAFEVYHDGALVWSKLNSGQTPNVHQITAALVRKTRAA